jgi:Rap1a immunity proteins
MRSYIIAASLALSVIGNAHGSVVDNGADAQKSCQSLVDSGFQDSGSARAAGSCEGMLETAMVFSPNMPTDVRACPPAQGSTVESAKVLLRYLDKNPARLSEAGITLAIEALRDAWPCEGDDATAPGRSIPGPKLKKRAPKKPKPQ